MTLATLICTALLLFAIGLTERALGPRGDGLTSLLALATLIPVFAYLANRIPWRHPVSWIAALAAVLLACAGAAGTPAKSGRPGQPAPAPKARHESAFPTPQELEDLGEAPLPEDVFSLDVRVVDRWRLEGPFPERVGATPVPLPAGAWMALAGFGAFASVGRSRRGALRG